MAQSRDTKGHASDTSKLKIDIKRRAFQTSQGFYKPKPAIAVQTGWQTAGSTAAQTPELRNDYATGDKY